MFINPFGKLGALNILDCGVFSLNADFDVVCESTVGGYYTLSARHS